MAVYSELIKNFEKIREYVRDFYIFGFHTRESFDAKSKRTYDNEKRRIESWLSDHVHTSLEGHKKKVSVQVDSGNIFQNPLYQCYRSKTFTDNDIRLHFILMDALEDNCHVGIGDSRLYFCKLRHDNRRADNPYQAKGICKRGLGVGGQKRKKYPIHQNRLLCR